MQTIIELINNYGYIILFGALVLELIAFPLPGELTMTYCGFLVYEAKMNWLFSILVATAGVISGITTSYFAGITLGTEFFKKYGSYIHLGPEHLKKTSAWFNSYGNSLLIFAYFIPGVRHLTGYFSGITKISYRKFALNAYIGAIIWTSTFISLGNFLGANWYKLHDYLREYTITGTLLILLILIIIYTYKFHNALTMNVFHKITVLFDSIGKIKFVIFSIAVALLGLFAYHTL